VRLLLDTHTFCVTGVASQMLMKECRRTCQPFITFHFEPRTSLLNCS